jgi:glutamate carboxypeptidase
MTDTPRAAALALHFEIRKAEILDLVRQLVERESSSEEPEHVSALSAWVAARLRAAGLEAATVPCPGRADAVLARWGAPAGGWLVLGHLDTVWPTGTLEEMPFAADGDMLRGPGVFDMKAGAAVAIAVLEAIARGDVQPREGGALLLTGDEETGSAASAVLVVAEARKRAAVLVLEPSADGGAAKIARKGAGFVQARFVGLAAHAGLEPQRGASALLEMARLAIFADALGDAEVGTSVVPTVASAGSRKNVVPEKAELTIDYRFWTEAEGARVTSALTTYRPLDDRVSLEVEGGGNRPAMEASPESLAIYHRAAGIARQLGFDLPPARVGSASDGNLTAAAGVPTVDGLGPAGGGAHARSEHVFTEDVTRRAALLAALLEEVP